MDDPEDEEDKCTCIVTLLQKHRRKLKKQRENELLTTGYALYHIDDPSLLEAPLDTEFFRTHTSVARSKNFINLRANCNRFRLSAGNYAVIPSTFDKNEEGEFMLRVFSEKKSNMSEVQEKTSYAPVKGVAPTQYDESNDKLTQFFEKIAGQDREMDAWELQKVLTYALQKEFHFDEFSLDTCRSMIACVDVSRTGKLELDEFKELWESIRDHTHITSLLLWWSEDR